MVFEGKLAAKLHAKDVEVGTSANRNPIQDQVTMETRDKAKSPWGGFTVLDLLTNKALILLRFNIMHQ